MSPIADMLVQLKNAQSAGHEHVTIPFSKLKHNIAILLKEKGFVADVDKKKKKGRNDNIELAYLDIALKYKDNEGMIRGIKLISKPSRRMYAGKHDMGHVRGGYGISIVSTSKGLMTGEDARKAGVGGELICEIW